MELSTILGTENLTSEPQQQAVLSADIAFIKANTTMMSQEELKHQHIIPVWLKDNEPLISHADFIDAMLEVVSHAYQHERVNLPNIRVSHPIKGRIPTAKDKPAKELLENEKTLYYERMMFVVEVPSITDTISGNHLSLTIGGIKVYSEDNMYNRKGALEHFKIFIGFQNAVCSNLCVSSDGVVNDLRVRSIQELQQGIYDMIIGYSLSKQITSLRQLLRYSLTENQFAQFIGRARLYQFLGSDQRRSLSPLKYSDSQMISVSRDYYQDVNFCREPDGSIGLWKLHNLFTGANKSSYIDSFLDRAANASSITSELGASLEHGSYNWFLS